MVISYIHLICWRMKSAFYERQHTLGGRVDVDRIVCEAQLELAGRVFSNNLIILKGQGLDAILGMSWMKFHKAMLDIAARLVHLNSPMYGNFIIHVPTISHIKAS
jgi:hypothetical protein